MENSIRLERTRKKNINKVHNEDSYNKRMNEIENETLDEVEKLLDEKHEDTTERVLDHTDKKVELKMIKDSSLTIDTLKSRCKSFLSRLFEKENTN